MFHPLILKNEFSVIKRIQRVDQINIIIKISSYITSIYIKTTYPNISKLKLIGKYNITNYNGLFGIKLDVNGETLWKLIRKGSLLHYTSPFLIFLHFVFSTRHFLSLNFHVNLLYLTFFIRLSKEKESRESLYEPRPVR